MAWIRRCPVYNRVEAVCFHITAFSIDPVSRLAKAVGVNKTVISKLFRGVKGPSFTLVFAVTMAIEKELGKPVDPRELFLIDGTFPTQSVCQFFDCGGNGCLPGEVCDDENNRKQEYRDWKAGQWKLTACTRPASRELEHMEEA